MKKFLKTRIYFDKEKTRWCQVMVFKEKYEMNKYYFMHDRNPSDGRHFYTQGVHMAGVLFRTEDDGSETMYGETGKVLLHFDQCGAGIVSHEFGHAVLCSHTMSVNGQQYPIIIHNMEEEEDILHDLYRAISSFYTWYWDKVDPVYGKPDVK
jgi:hypothetical protein